MMRPMTQGPPHPAIIFVEVPCAGVDWSRRTKPLPHYRHHRADRDAPRPPQPIPTPGIDRVAVQRLLEQGRRALADARL
jgi:hypothetical protein